MTAAHATCKTLGCTTNDEKRAAILALSEALDPQRQGMCWPDPIEWDGRPLTDQASDLLVLADAQEPDEYSRAYVAIRDAANALRGCTR